MDKQDVNLDDLAKFGDKAPVFVYVQKPTELTKLKEMYQRISEYNSAPCMQMELYKSLLANYAEIQSKQADINEIINTNSQIHK